MTSTQRSTNDSEDFDTLQADDFDVTCPGCDSSLTSDPVFQKYRICPVCNRHFWIPAREHLHLLIDSGSFREINSEIVSTNPLLFRDGSPGTEALARISANPNSESLVTGEGKLGGQDVVIVAIDFALLGDAIGIVAGEKIVLAIERAATRRLPLISVSTSGSQRGQDGLLSLLQYARIANAMTRLQKNAVPMIALLAHPSTGGVFTGFAGHANFLFAEPGADLGFSTSASQWAAVALPPVDRSAATVLEQGALDGIVDRRRQQDSLINLVDLLNNRIAPRPSAAPVSRQEPLRSVAESVAIVKHPERPSAMSLIERIMPGFVELHGDRVDSDSDAVRIGLGQIDGVSVGVIVVDARIAEDGQGGLTSGSYRKAMRLQELAAHFELPIVTLVDHSQIALVAERVSASLALQMAAMTRSSMSLQVPTVAIITGEAQGAPALSFALADRSAMLENAVISGSRPDRTAAGIAIPAAGSNRPHWMSARECLRLNLVDAVISEPVSGAHTDAAATAQQVRLAVLQALAETAAVGPRRLADERSRRFRRLGVSTPISDEALNKELDQFQELQRTVGRSIDDLRTRLETYSGNIPARSNLPSRPPVPGLSLPNIPNLPTIRRPSVNKTEITEIRDRLATKKQEITGRVQEVRTAGLSQRSSATESDVDRSQTTAERLGDQTENDIPIE